MASITLFIILIWSGASSIHRAGGFICGRGVVPHGSSRGMCGDSEFEVQGSRTGGGSGSIDVVTLMRDKEYRVTGDEVSTPNGTVAEVKVPERELSLMFVTPEVFQQSGKA